MCFTQLKFLTYFDKICPVVVCNQTGMSGEHVEQDPVGMPAVQGLPDLLAWTSPSSGHTNTQTPNS